MGLKTFERHHAAVRALTPGLPDLSLSPLPQEAKQPERSQARSWSQGRESRRRNGFAKLVLFQTVAEQSCRGRADQACDIGGAGIAARVDLSLQRKASTLGYILQPGLGYGEHPSWLRFASCWSLTVHSIQSYARPEKSCLSGRWLFASINVMRPKCLLFGRRHQGSSVAFLRKSWLVV